MLVGRSYIRLKNKYLCIDILLSSFITILNHARTHPAHQYYIDIALLFIKMINSF